MKKKILVIDDSVTSSNNVNRMFTSERVNNLIEMFTASNGFDGICQAVKIKPDLIIMDWHMDGLDGLQSIFILRQHEEFKNTPIIMLSGDGSVIDQAKCTLMGANEFIGKGLAYDKYFHTINSYLDLQTN